MTGPSVQCEMLARALGGAWLLCATSSLPPDSLDAVVVTAEVMAFVVGWLAQQPKVITVCHVCKHPQVSFPVKLVVKELTICTSGSKNVIHKMVPLTSR